MSDKDVIVPKELTREELLRRFNKFMAEDELVSKDFWKYFGNKQATHPMPIPSLYDCVNAAVCYDAENNFDLRMLITLVFPEDRKLFVDAASFVAERYVKRHDKPASQLTLSQFKAELTRRLIQLGF